MSVALVTIKADGKLYLKLTEGCVHAFENVQKALQYYEDGYNRSHRRGYEASMSALLNAITYEPSIHIWEGEDVSGLITEGVINQDTFRAYRLSNVSGSIEGGLITGLNAEKFHESGMKPRMIS